jgi:hypothetical protein
MSAAATASFPGLPEEPMSISGIILTVRADGARSAASRRCPDPRRQAGINPVTPALLGVG